MERYKFDTLPSVGAWKLSGAYDGHEVVRFASNDTGIHIEGTSVGVEEGSPWSIHYVIAVDTDWHFQHAHITDYDGNQLDIQLDNSGAWTVNGERQPELQGCHDLDLEASVITNTLAVHRLALGQGEHGKSAAAYIRTRGLAVERLDQTYTRLPDAAEQLCFDYHSPRFDYHDTLRFEGNGLTAAYPGIGERIL